MTLAEFKAWLDGFTEAVGDAPTPEQWQKVLTKLAEVPSDRLDLMPLSPSPLETQLGRYWWQSPVSCGGTSAGLPGWLKGATLTNMAPLDAVASAAIFSDVASLYQN